MPEDSGVVVTLADIYHAQQETTVALAEIKGALALQSAQDRNDKATLSDHESRIRKVEAKIYAVGGVVGLLAALPGLYAVFGR